MAHPIESLMQTTMENLKDMVDVNTVVGDPVIGDGYTMIPVTRVSVGFVAGGGEYECDKNLPPQPGKDTPFAGGTGSGMTVNPIGFLVVGKGTVRFLNTHFPTAADRMIEQIPQLVSQLKRVLSPEAPQGEDVPSVESGAQFL